MDIFCNLLLNLLLNSGTTYFAVTLGPICIPHIFKNGAVVPPMTNTVSNTILTVVPVQKIKIDERIVQM